MNASKTLIAAIAAATIVGTVGFVSAQTTDSNAPAAQATEPTPNTATPPDMQQQQAPAATPSDMSSPPYVAPQADTSAAPSDSTAAPAAPSSDTSTTPSAAPSSDSNSMSSEPAPKADRN